MFVFFIIFFPFAYCQTTEIKSLESINGCIKSVISEFKASSEMYCAASCEDKCLGFQYDTCKGKCKLIGDFSYHPEGKETFYVRGDIPNSFKEPGNDFSCTLLVDSTVLTNTAHQPILAKIIGPNLNTLSWKLCYRGSDHQFEASTFHDLCDNKGPTLVLIKNGVYVFGGYADISWKKEDKWKKSNESFIFSLNRDIKMMPTLKPNLAIYHRSNGGPTFGRGHAICILNAHDLNKSYCNPGIAYQLPNGITYDSYHSRIIFAGSYYFTPDDYEVYYIIN